MAQGGALSALLLNVYLNDVLDTKWKEIHPGIPLIRVADDLLLLCRDAEEAISAHRDLQRLLRPTGMKTKGSPEQDIVQLGKGQKAEWLGYSIPLSNGKIIAQPSTRFEEKVEDHLTQEMQEADGALLVTQSLRGVIEQLGPCYTHVDRAQLIRQLTAIAGRLGIDAQGFA